MSSVQYYVASSLDGFIATPDDDLAWLLQFDGFEGGKESYDSFMAGVGCIVMGGDHLPVADGPRARQLALSRHALLGLHPPRVHCAARAPTSPSCAATSASSSTTSGRTPPARTSGWWAAVTLPPSSPTPGCWTSSSFRSSRWCSGNGKRLLPLEGPTPPLELVESRTQGRGIVELRYRFGAGSDSAGQAGSRISRARRRLSPPGATRRCPGSGW